MYIANSSDNISLYLTKYVGIKKIKDRLLVGYCLVSTHLSLCLLYLFGLSLKLFQYCFPVLSMSAYSLLLHTILLGVIKYI